jgi:UBX domain-containing protein 1/4
VQGALDWIEKNQDKPLDEIKATEASKAEDDDDEEATQAKIAELESGQVAKSMVCNECGKKFRSLNAAEFHASKT